MVELNEQEILIIIIQNLIVEGKKICEAKKYNHVTEKIAITALELNISKGGSLSSVTCQLPNNLGLGSVYETTHTLTIHFSGAVCQAFVFVSIVIHNKWDAPTYGSTLA